MGGRPWRREFSWAVGPAHVRKELREQGTRDEDLVTIVPHDTRLTSESLVKTNEVHKEPIKSII